MVREERASAAGDEKPATKSRASTYYQFRKRDQGDAARETDRREWSRARSTVSNRENRGPARIPRLLRGISPESRGDERKSKDSVHRVGGKTAPVTAREERAVAGRQLSLRSGDVLTLVRWRPPLRLLIQKTIICERFYWVYILMIIIEQKSLKNLRR